MPGCKAADPLARTSERADLVLVVAFIRFGFVFHVASSLNFAGRTAASVGIYAPSTMRWSRSAPVPSA